jgi:hypothetical protein
MERNLPELEQTIEWKYKPVARRVRDGRRKMWKDDLEACTGIA